jgi:transcriptional regulator with XRE-family HTH domain
MNLQITMKKMREAKGLTQMELSEKAVLGSSTIGEIERGMNASTVKTLEKIAKALKLNMEEKVELFLSMLPEDVSNYIESKMKNTNVFTPLEKTILLAFKENDLSSDFEKELLLNMMKEILKRNNI